MKGKQPPQTFDEQVELLGAILQSDGDTQRDTANRLKQARKLWWKIQRQVRKLGMSGRRKIGVLRATVEASLFYASETRTYSQREEDMLQSFLNRCLRGCVMSASFRLEDMKGNITMSDLRAKHGQETVTTTIGKRKLTYIGHLLRYPADRVESQDIARPPSSGSSLPAHGTDTT